ncbi:MAG: HlyU family transcriptional regulator [Geminicoccaceae bacterium]
MVFGVLKSLFGGGSGGEDAPTAETIEHAGYQITPEPFRAGGQWQTAGIIRKEVDGQLKEHRFIRADTIGDLDEARAHSLRKAKQIIDEQGDRMFAG